MVPGRSILWGAQNRNGCAVAIQPFESYPFGLEGDFPSCFSRTVGARSGIVYRLNRYAVKRYQSNSHEICVFTANATSFGNLPVSQAEIRAKISGCFGAFDVARPIPYLKASVGCFGREMGISGTGVFCTGTFERNLDDKQRLLLPKTVKKSLSQSESIFLTPGQDGCLELHTYETLQSRSSDEFTNSRNPAI